MPDQTPADEPLPNWFTALSQRAHGQALRDADLDEALHHILQLRREKARLYADLVAARARNSTPGPVILDRFEAVLDYVSAALTDAPLEAVPYLQGVAARLNGREA